MSITAMTLGGLEARIYINLIVLMDKKTILEIINAPFASFELETNGGKRIQLLHRDNLLFSPDDQYVIVWTEQGIELLYPGQIASVHVVPPKPKRAG